MRFWEVGIGQAQIAIPTFMKAVREIGYGSTVSTVLRTIACFIDSEPLMDGFVITDRKPY